MPLYNGRIRFWQMDRKEEGRDESGAARRKKEEHEKCEECRRTERFQYFIDSMN